MDPNNPPRWAADPTGRHQYRYWDGADWTDQVSDNGAVSTDPPVASPQTGTPPFPGGLVASAPAAAAPPAPATWAPPGGAQQYQYPAVPPDAAAPVPGGPWYGNRDSTAVLGRRYGAFFIDLVVCVIAFAVLFMAFATQRTVAETLRLPGCHYATNSSASDSNRQIECDNRAVFRVGDTVYEAEVGPTFGLFLLFTLLVFMLPEALAGASLGKLMTGIRVVRPDGSHIGIGRSLLRWLLFWVDGPLTLFLCGIITSAVSRGHRRLGDMAADSYVVGKADAGRPVSLPPGR
jgi:uncharacterized RDD family membrane protein YckC